jgi:hypothetical protein
MEDAAAVVGMRASAVYVYYATEAELLMTALQRSTATCSWRWRA